MVGERKKMKILINRLVEWLESKDIPPDDDEEEESITVESAEK